MIVESVGEGEAIGTWSTITIGVRYSDLAVDKRRPLTSDYLAPIHMV